MQQKKKGVIDATLAKGRNTGQSFTWNDVLELLQF